jgi:hypothetical protein
VASKQRTPSREHEPTRPEVRTPARAPEHESAEASGGVRAPESASPTLSPGGEAERISLALCVVPRAGAETAHLVSLVESSALAADRKAELTGRLEAQQAAADHVSAVVSGAFGTDSGALRSSLLDALRAPIGPEGLHAGVAAAIGQPEAAVRALCDGLGGWVGWWWDEEEEEEAAPGDYAAEESGS